MQGGPSLLWVSVLDLKNAQHPILSNSEKSVVHRVETHFLHGFRMCLNVIYLFQRHFPYLDCTWKFVIPYSGEENLPCVVYRQLGEHIAKVL